MSNFQRFLEAYAAEVSALSFLVTVVGFGLTVKMLFSANKAIKNSIRTVTEQVERNVTLSSMTECRKMSEEIQDLMRQRKPDAALLRVRDLHDRLIQFRSFEQFKPGEQRESLDNFIREIGEMQTWVGRLIENADAEIDIAELIRKFEDLNVGLSGWVGAMRFHVQ